MIYSTLPLLLSFCDKKRVLLRVDWNLSYQNQNVLDTFRIKASFNTIDYLIKKDARILIITHWSRPLGFEYRFSTEHLQSILIDSGYNFVFIPSISLIKKYFEEEGTSNLFLLENIRFLPHEKSCSQLLAKKIFLHCDYFIEESFGTLAKKSCTTTVLPYYFEKNKRSIGYLISKELEILDSIRSYQASQIVLIIGGAKIHEKIESLLDAILITDTVLLLPPLVEVYQKVLDGKTDLIDKQLVNLMAHLIAFAKTKEKKILIPVDFQIKSFNGAYSFVSQDRIMVDDQIIGIGPATIQLYHAIIEKRSLIFTTGICGFIHDTKSWYTALNLFNTKKQLIVAGGDSVMLIQKLFNATSQSIQYLTGGSASLAYLGRGNLPGLDPFKKEDIALKN